jgi:hypothetical protein
MIRVAVAGLVASSGLMVAMTMSGGIASADEIQVNRTYPTLSACEADGPYVELSRNNQLWTHWDCRQGADGLYYLYLTN